MRKRAASTKHTDDVVDLTLSSPEPSTPSLPSPPHAKRLRLPPPSPTPPTSSLPPLIGTASWSVARAAASHFPSAGSHLQRYSATLPCVEVNTAFYRHHSPATWARWAAATPAGFLFSVKLHRDITHTHRLRVSVQAIADCLSPVKALGSKLSVLLVQLPPSLAFDRAVADAFFDALRLSWQGAAVVEARHASWAADQATAVLERTKVGRVIADPDKCPAAVVSTCPVVYFRLHGSPDMYKSTYSDDALHEWAARMRGHVEAGARVWCVFDNTQFGHATENAVTLKGMVVAGE